MNSLITVVTAILGFLTAFLPDAYAHPHHAEDFVGNLGLDHMLMGLAVITFAAFFAGKFSK